MIQILFILSFKLFIFLSLSLQLSQSPVAIHGQHIMLFGDVSLGQSSYLNVHSILYGRLC